MIITSGSASEALLRNPVNVSNSRKRATSGEAGSGGGRSGNRSRSSGSSCASSRPPRVVSAFNGSGPRSRTRPRSDWIHGQYAGAPPASQQRPHSTRAPADSALAANSSASLVLPIPGCPPSSRSFPRPDIASSTALSSAPISDSRPTNHRLSPAAADICGASSPAPVGGKLPHAALTSWESA